MDWPRGFMLYRLMGFPTQTWTISDVLSIETYKIYSRAVVVKWITRWTVDHKAHKLIITISVRYNCRKIVMPFRDTINLTYMYLW